MYNFNYYTPTKVVFGKNTEDKCGELVKEQGCKKVMIHYGSGSVKRTGLLDKVKASLDEAKIDYIELGGAVPNPRLSLVYEGIELAKKRRSRFHPCCRRRKCDRFCKSNRIWSANEGDVWDFYDKKRQATGCLPIGVVLTIAATGSEMSNSSVITKEDGWIKRGYRNDYGRPRFAIMNPELTMTLPDYQTACGCTDILMHTMERYFTNGGNMEITDSIAEGLMRTVIENARILINDPKNYDARAEVMWAGSLSHNGLTGCGAVVGGDFASHALEHEIGGLFDVAHGAALRQSGVPGQDDVYKDCLSRFEKFAMNVMRVDPEGTADDVALRGIEAIEDFFRELKMPTSIHELGIDPTDEELKLMAHKCSIGCKGSKGSAKVLHEEDMYKIYKAAL